MQALCLSVQNATGAAACIRYESDFPFNLRKHKFPNEFCPVNSLDCAQNLSMVLLWVSGMWPGSLRTPNCQSRMNLGRLWGDEVLPFPWKQIHKSHMASY